MTLQGLFYLGLSSNYPPLLAAVGPSRVGNLFTYVCPTNHSSIRGAVDFILPYVQGKSWPFPTEPGTTDFRGAYGLLRQAAHAWSDASYQALAEALPGSHDDPALLWWPDL